MLSMISWRRFAGLLEGNDPIPFDFATQAFFSNRFGENIDASAGKILNTFANVFEGAEIAEPGVNDALLQ